MCYYDPMCLCGKKNDVGSLLSFVAGRRLNREGAMTQGYAVKPYVALCASKFLCGKCSKKKKAGRLENHLRWSC